MIKNCDKNNKKIEIKPPGRFSHLDLRGFKKKSSKVYRMHECSKAEQRGSFTYHLELHKNCIFGAKVFLSLIALLQFLYFSTFLSSHFYFGMNLQSFYTFCVKKIK